MDTIYLLQCKFNYDKNNNDNENNEIKKYVDLKFALSTLNDKDVKNSLKMFNDEDIQSHLLFEPHFINLLDYFIFKYSRIIHHIFHKEITNKEHKDDLKSFLTIINLLCSKYPWMITKSLYEKNLNVFYVMTEIFNRYYIDTEETSETNQCFLCNKSINIQLINKPCECVNSYTHICCLVKHINNKGDVCKLCNTSFGSYKTYNNYIVFPKLNIYVHNVLPFYIVSNEKHEKLKYACHYMIDDKCKELLDTFSDEEFKLYVKNANTYTYDKFGNLIILKSKINPEKTNNINKLLLDKCINILDYSVTYETNVSFGKYMWCGKMNSPTGSGYVLSTNNKAKAQHMILIKMRVNEKILRDATFYDVYTHTGFLFSYNIDRIHLNIIILKPIEEKLIGTELEVIFSKKKLLTQEEQEIVTKRLMRTPREEIYSIKIKIPELKIYGNENECNICLENIDDINNKYITPCGHLFHLNCMYTYFDTNNLLYPKHPGCTQFCCDTRKVKDFNCVVCNKIVKTK